MGEETGTNSVKTVKESILENFTFIILAVFVLGFICCLSGIGAYMYGCCTNTSTRGEDVEIHVEEDNDVDIKII